VLPPTESAEVNPALRGWLNYFSTFYPSAVTPIAKRVDRHLMRWAKWSTNGSNTATPAHEHGSKGSGNGNPAYSRTGHCGTRPDT
jgi:SRSO17 transposase